MPHTNRKTKSQRDNPKSKIVHTKRQQIEDHEGWTHVVDTPRRSTPAKKTQWLHAGDFERNGVSYINRTLEEVQKDFEHYTKQWEGHEACQTLKTRLEDPAGRNGVGNVVVLGLGSLQSARREGRRASYTQLAALRTMVGTLEGEKLEYIFQDPQFTDLDKDFLTSLGYATVDDPEAFGKIKETSLVYAIHCYADVYKSISEGPRPSIIVGTDIGHFGRFNLSDTSSDIEKSLEDMVKDCDELDFPQVRHDFSDTKIYWRKGSGTSIP